MILNILLSASLAAAWIVKAPEANPAEFAVYSQNTDQEKISQHFLKCSQAMELTDLLKRAQFQFLNSSVDTAKASFEAISQMKWNCDWKITERKIIVFALMRLAQLEERAEDQARLVAEAVNFDDGIFPDVSVFPPPLMNLYRRTKDNLRQTSILLSSSVLKMGRLYRNGKSISMSETGISLSPLRARYTLSSDAHEPETRFVTAQELSAWQPDPRPLVRGRCEQFELADSLQNLKEVEVFFAMNCVKKKGAIPAAVAESSPTVPWPATPAEAPVKRKSWLERNIVWVGVAVVSSLVVAHQVSRSNDEPHTVVVPSNTLTTP